MTIDKKLKIILCKNRQINLFNQFSYKLFIEFLSIDSLFFLY